jgi:hypothetical protein
MDIRSVKGSQARRDHRLDFADKPSVLTALRLIAIQLFYGMTFFSSAWMSFTQETPSWFNEQFSNTVLASMPGALNAVYYFVATLETVAMVGFLTSFLMLESFDKKQRLLKASLTLSLFIFLIMAYGFHLTRQHDVFESNFLYFIGTIIVLRSLEKQERVEMLIVPRNDS